MIGLAGPQDTETDDEAEQQDQPQQQETLAQRIARRKAALGLPADTKQQPQPTSLSSRIAARRHALGLDTAQPPGTPVAAAPVAPQPAIPVAPPAGAPPAPVEARPHDEDLSPADEQQQFRDIAGRPVPIAPSRGATQAAADYLRQFKQKPMTVATTPAEDASAARLRTDKGDVRIEQVGVTGDSTHVRILDPHKRLQGEDDNGVLTVPTAAIQQPMREAHVAVGRPLSGIEQELPGMSQPEVERAANSPVLGTRIAVRLAMLRAPSGMVVKGRQPEWNDVVAKTVVNGLASWIPGVPDDEDTGEVMEQYVRNGGKMEPWQINILAGLHASSALLGAHGLSTALGVGKEVTQAGAEAFSGSGEATPEAIKAARQAGARASTGANLAGTRGGAMLEAASSPMGSVGSAFRSGGQLAVQEAAVKLRVAPSRIEQALSDARAGLKARTPQLVEAGKQAVVQGGIAAGITGAGEVAAGERDPRKIFEEMGKAALIWGGIGGGMSGLTAEAEFKAGYKIMKAGLEKSGLADELGAEGAARAKAAPTQAGDEFGPSGDLVSTRKPTPKPGAPAAAAAPPNAAEVRLTPEAAAKEKFRAGAVNSFLDRNQGTDISNDAAQSFTDDHGLSGLSEQLADAQGVTIDKVQRKMAVTFRDLTAKGMAPKDAQAEVQRQSEENLAFWSKPPREYVPKTPELGRPATEDEMLTRNIAQGLKTQNPEAIKQAAPEMAQRIPPNAILVPLPDHTGSVDANSALAEAIAGHANNGSEVHEALGRQSVVESSRARRQAGKPGLTADEHEASMVKYGEIPEDRPVVLIDNLDVSGNTAEGARRVLGRPDARLVTYATGPVPAFEKMPVGKPAPVGKKTAESVSPKAESVSPKQNQPAKPVAETRVATAAERAAVPGGRLNTPEEIEARDRAPVPGEPREPAERRFPATKVTVNDLAREKGTSTTEAVHRLRKAGYDISDEVLKDVGFEAETKPAEEATPAATRKAPKKIVTPSAKKPSVATPEQPAPEKAEETGGEPDLARLKPKDRKRATTLLQRVHKVDSDQNPSWRAKQGRIKAVDELKKMGIQAPAPPPPPPVVPKIDQAIETAEQALAHAREGKPFRTQTWERDEVEDVARAERRMTRLKGMKERLEAHDLATKPVHEEDQRLRQARHDLSEEIDQLREAHVAAMSEKDRERYDEMNMRDQREETEKVPAIAALIEKQEAVEKQRDEMDWPALDTKMLINPEHTGPTKEVSPALAEDMYNDLADFSAKASYRNGADEAPDPFAVHMDHKGMENDPHGYEQDEEALYQLHLEMQEAGLPVERPADLEAKVRAFWADKSTDELEKTQEKLDEEANDAEWGTPERAKANRLSELVKRELSRRQADREREEIQASAGPLSTKAKTNNHAWKGNISTDESKFLVDGQTLIVKKFLTDEKLTKKLATRPKLGQYEQHRQRIVEEKIIDQLWADTLADLTEPAEILFVLEKSGVEATPRSVFLRGKDGTMLRLSADKVELVMNGTGADNVKIQSASKQGDQGRPNKGALFLKGKEPVGLSMGLGGEDDSGVDYEKAIAQAKQRAAEAIVEGKAPKRIGVRDEEEATPAKGKKTKLKRIGAEVGTEAAAPSNPAAPKRIGVPLETTAFRSGANRPSEIRGFAEAGQHVGVAVNELDEKALQELESLAGSKTKVFVDSGIFSDGVISEEEWTRRLAVYQRLSDKLGDQLYVVAPDVIGDQEGTQRVLSTFQQNMRKLAKASHVIIPIQNGELSAADFYQQLKDDKIAPYAFIPAMPMNKSAMTPDEVVRFVEQVDPTSIHLLGMGPDNKAFAPLIARLQEESPALKVTHDANAIRAKVGKANGPGGGPRELTANVDRVRAEGIEGVHGEATGKFGEREDYTDDISEPARWLNKKQLVDVGDAAGLEGDDLQRFVDDPGAFLQDQRPNSDIHWWEDPDMMKALNDAWHEHVQKSLAATTRSEAVRRTFTEEPKKIGIQKGSVYEGDENPEALLQGGISQARSHFENARALQDALASGVHPDTNRKLTPKQTKQFEEGLKRSSRMYLGTLQQIEQAFGEEQREAAVRQVEGISPADEAAAIAEQKEPASELDISEPDISPSSNQNEVSIGQSSNAAEREEKLRDAIARYEKVNLTKQGRRRLEKWKAELAGVEAARIPRLGVTRITKEQIAQVKPGDTLYSDNGTPYRVDEVKTEQRTRVAAVTNTETGESHPARPISWFNATDPTKAKESVTKTPEKDDTDVAKVQRIGVTEVEGRASASDLDKLFGAALLRAREGMYSDPQALRKWAGDVLGRPYESGTWQMDDVYDAIEGAVNQWFHNVSGSLYDEKGRERSWPNILSKLRMAKEVEDKFFRSRLRSTGMLERQQFSTPLSIATAAAYAIGARPNEKVLEPSAGTGNLINALRDAGIAIHANEIDPRRLSILNLQSYQPTSIDALRIPLTGLRVNGVVLNPPYGGYSTGKYHGRGALPFADGDVSQRHVYAALQSLVDGGRLVAIMPENVLGTAGKSFVDWLDENHTLRVFLHSPPGAYNGRGTGIGTIMMVVDKGRQPNPDQYEVWQPQDWPAWEAAMSAFNPLGKFYRGNENAGRGPAVDVEPTKGKTSVTTETGKTSAEASGVPESKPQPRIGRGVAKGSGGESGESGPAAAGSDKSTVGPRNGAEPGAERSAEVVAGEPSGSAGGEAPVVSAAPDMVPQSAGGRVEPRPGDSEQRQRELAAANDSPVFTPYAVRTPERRAPHPRLVVETRSMAGMPSPDIQTEPQSPAFNKAWGRSGAKGGLSDEQADAVLRTTTAWKKGHGILVSDDVGVGKSREAAASALEAIAQGAKRIIYLTKNETNLIDIQREFRAVASGDEEGKFPAEFVVVADYPTVKKGESALPMPNGPTIYFAHSYNFRDFSEGLMATQPDTLLADEAHEFKNLFADRGMAWTKLHRQMLNNPKARFAYYTATPGVGLDEVGYLFGLREWTVGGFSDWVEQHLGLGSAKSDKERAEAAAAEQAARDEATSLGDTDQLAQDDKNVAGGKKGFMRGVDIFNQRVTPAETEQIMRELKGSGKYISRDLWRGGVQFDVDTLDMTSDEPEAILARERYDRASALARDISSAAAKFGRLNKKVKTSGLDRALLQSYMKQLLFDLRFPRVLEKAEEALKAGQQVVISVHSVAGDADLEEGLSAEDAEIPPSKRLESAINRINTQHIEKEGEGSAAEYTDLGEIPEAVMAIAELRERAKGLKPLQDPIRAVQDRLGAKNVAAITGKVSAKKRKELMAEFQAGQRKVAVISKAGKVGISLHDVNGKRRRMVVADYEWSADTFKQELGRVDRTGQVSDPHVTLLASSIAGEKKFAATIAARMSALGATSKGSAESTGTDALDQFDISDNVSLAAAKKTIEELPTELKDYLTSNKFYEWRYDNYTRDWTRMAKRTPDKMSIRDFLLDLLMFPVKEADAVWARWVQNRASLMSDEHVQALMAKRTGRLEGEILRRTKLNKEGEPSLQLIEVKNAEGERRGILQGFVTSYISRIQNARGTDERGMTKTRRYIQFTSPEGLVSGLELTPSEIQRVKSEFGAGGRNFITPDNAWDDLHAGDRIKVHGAKGTEWTLRLRQDGKIAVDGATLSKNQGDLQGVANYSTVGNFLFVPGDRAAFDKFLARFALRQPEKREGGNDVGQEFYSVGDPFTAAWLMWKKANQMRKLRQQSGGAIGSAVDMFPDPAGLEADRSQFRPSEIFPAIRRLVNPESFDESSKGTAQVLAHENALSARKVAMANEALRDMSRRLGKLSREEGTRVWTAAETGRTTGDKELDALAKLVHQVTAKFTKELIKLDRLKESAAREHYIGRFWSMDPETLGNFLNKIRARSPIEGPKSFLRHRTWDTFVEGLRAIYEAKKRIAAGNPQKGDLRLARMRPATYNYVDSQLAKINEMQRVIGVERTLRIERAHGRGAPILSGRPIPVDENGDKWVPLGDGTDPAFKVWGPRRGMVKLPGGASIIPDPLHPDENEEMQPQDVEVVGAREIGRWYGPRSSAAVWDASMSKGLRGNAIYDALSAPSTAAAQLLLGFSGFHLANIAREGINSSLAAAVDEMVNHYPPRVGEAAKDIVRGATGAAAVQDAIFGKKIMEAFRNPEAHTELQQVLNAMIAGGFRGQAESELWSGDRVRKLEKAFTEAVHGQTAFVRAKGAAKLPLDAVWAALELQMAPLMKFYVPWMKTAATYRAVASELAKLPPDTSIDEIRRRMRRIVKQMDYRYGHVVYDNHFMNRVVKDLAQLFFLAPGWTFGTTTLMGKGLVDAASIPRNAAKRAVGGGGPPRWVGAAGGADGHWESPDGGGLSEDIIGRSAAYWIGAVLFLAAVSGILTYLHTGERPRGLDYFNYRDGSLDSDGNPNRHQVPGYEKDAYGWSHHPVTTFENKIAPMINFMVSALRNRDYYGNEVYNPDDSRMDRAKQLGAAYAKSVKPLSVQNYEQAASRGEASPAEMARNAFGITPAKQELVRTPAQNKMAELLSLRGRSVLTPEQQDAKSQLRTIRRSLMKGPDDSTTLGDTARFRQVQDSVRARFQRGELRPGQVSNIMTEAATGRYLAQHDDKDTHASLVMRFKQLTAEEARKVYDLGAPWEKALWAPYLKPKEDVAKRIGHPLPTGK